MNDLDDILRNKYLSKQRMEKFYDEVKRDAMRDKSNPALFAGIRSNNHSKLNSSSRQNSTML